MFFPESSSDVFFLCVCYFLYLLAGMGMQISGYQTAVREGSVVESDNEDSFRFTFIPEFCYMSGFCILYGLFLDGCVC